MLVLSRKKGERIMIASGIQVTVLGMCGNCVRLGFVAPEDVPIFREEVFRRLESERHAETVLPYSDRQATMLPESA